MIQKLKYSFNKASNILTTSISSCVLLECMDIPEFDDMDSIECVILSNGADIPDEFYDWKIQAQHVWYFNHNSFLNCNANIAIGKTKFEDGFLSFDFCVPDLKYDRMFIFYKSRRLQRDNKLNQLI